MPLLFCKCEAVASAVFAAAISRISRFSEIFFIFAGICIDI